MIGNMVTAVSEPHIKAVGSVTFCGSKVGFQIIAWLVNSILVASVGSKVASGPLVDHLNLFPTGLRFAQAEE